MAKKQTINAEQRFLQALDKLLKDKKPAQSFDQADDSLSSNEIYELLNDLFVNEAYGQAQDNIILEEELIGRGYRYELMPTGFLWLFKQAE
jgi:hypothetical protein